MKTENAQVNELPDDAYQWYLPYLTALDAKDIDASGAFLAPTVELIMNNADPVTGHDAVVAGLSEYWATFGTVEHEPLVILGSPRTFVLEALNHCTTLDDRQVTLRAVAFTDRDEDGLVTSVRLYPIRARLQHPALRSQRGYEPRVGCRNEEDLGGATTDAFIAPPMSFSVRRRCTAGKTYPPTSRQPERSSSRPASLVEQRAKVRPPAWAHRAQRCEQEFPTSRAAPSRR